VNEGVNSGVFNPWVLNCLLFVFYRMSWKMYFFYYGDQCTPLMVEGLSVRSVIFGNGTMDIFPCNSCFNGKIFCVNRFIEEALENN